MLKIESFDHYKIMTLNRPEVHNAFHPELIEQITEAYKVASRDQELNFILLKGEGKSFCAGADLKWMKDMANFNEEENIEDAKKLFDMFGAIYSCSVPTITYVHGNVFGGALGLVAASDIVIAEEKTRFCFSEVKWGLAPATIVPFLVAKIGLSKASQFMLSAEVFSSAEACAMNLVHKSVQDVNYKTEIKDLTKTILENGREAMYATKKLLQTVSYNPLDYREPTAKVIAERRVSAEGQGGLDYFVSKTMPAWKKPSSGIDI